MSAAPRPPEAFRLPTLAEQAQTLAEVLHASATAERATGHLEEAGRYQEAAAYAEAAAVTLNPSAGTEDTCPPT